MSKKKEGYETGDEEVLITEIVERKIENSRRAAEICGCGRCVGYYQSWVEWRDMVAKSGGSEVPPEPIPPSPSDLPPDHPKFGPDDPPPSLDSGHLADWYMSGMG